MIKSFIFSALGTALIVLGIGFWVNNWFLQGYNWLWIAIPSFWVCWQVFSRLFKVLDILIGIGIIALIVILHNNGIGFPTFG
jgi:hypothetical protein